RLQRFAERRSVPLSFRIVRTPHPYCDRPHAHGLLRPRRERPRRGRAAAEQRDELAASHVLLSSRNGTIQHRCRNCRVVMPGCIIAADNLIYSSGGSVRSHTISELRSSSVILLK